MEIRDPKRIVRGFFNDDLGEPFILTSGQVEIFSAIYDPDITRVAVKCMTQYGKSNVASIATIMVMMDRVEKVLIVAPMMEQSKIIMGYIIQHLFDNELFVKSLEFEGSLERLRQERSKQRITLTNGSEVFILTANVKEVAKEARSLMGFGASIVLCLPYSEKVLTEKGYLRIGEIVDNKLNLRVASYNHLFGRIEYQSIEEYEKNDGRELVEISVGKRKVICTVDHPVYVVGKGYIKAGNVMAGDKVWVLG